MNRKQKDKKQKLSEFGEGVWAAEKLLKKRKIRGQTEYLVKWKGWSDEDNTWEPINNIIDKRLIKEFEQRKNKNEPIKSNSRIKNKSSKLAQTDENEKNKIVSKDIKKEDDTKIINKLDSAVNETNFNDNILFSKKNIDKQSCLDEFKKTSIFIEQEEPSDLKINLKKNKEKKNETEENKVIAEEIEGNKVLEEEIEENKVLEEIEENKVLEEEIEENKVLAKEIEEDNKTKIEEENLCCSKEKNFNEITPSLSDIFVAKNDTDQILDKNEIFEKPINVEVSSQKKETNLLTHSKIENKLKVNTQESFITSNIVSLKNEKEDNFLTESGKNIINNSFNWHSKNNIYSSSIKSKIEEKTVLVKDDINKTNSKLILNLYEKSKKDSSYNSDKCNKTSKNNYVNLSLLNTNSFSYSMSNNNHNNCILNNNFNYFTNPVNDKLKKNSSQKLSFKVNETINSIKINNEPVNYLSNYSSNELDKKNSLLSSSILQKNTKIKSTSSMNSNTNQLINMSTIIKEDTKIPLNSFQQANSKIYDAKQQTVKRILPPPDFWKKQNSLINQIIVTDVMNDNNELITIRECRTPKDFFKKSLTKKKKLSNKKTKLSNKKIRKLLKKKKISLNC